jgi:hypothetical protein
MRLFVGEPVWTPYNRPQDDHPIRLASLSNIGERTLELTVKSPKVGTKSTILKESFIFATSNTLVSDLNK